MSNPTDDKGSIGSTQALWRLTRGQRGRFLAALICLAIGAALMYVGPQIVRFAIDGILEKRGDHPVPNWVNRILVAIDAQGHPTRALILAGCAVPPQSQEEYAATVNADRRVWPPYDPNSAFPDQIMDGESRSGARSSGSRDIEGRDNVRDSAGRDFGGRDGGGRDGGGRGGGRR